MFTSAVSVPIRSFIRSLLHFIAYPFKHTAGGNGTTLKAVAIPQERFDSAGLDTVISPGDGVANVAPSIQEPIAVPKLAIAAIRYGIPQLAVSGFVAYAPKRPMLTGKDANPRYAADCAAVAPTPSAESITTQFACDLCVKAPEV